MINNFIFYKHRNGCWVSSHLKHFGDSALQTRSQYVFPEIKLRGLVPNFHIFMYLDIPTIGLPILLQPNRRTDSGNI
jgi:hypothetical protein